MAAECAAGADVGQAPLAVTTGTAGDATDAFGEENAGPGRGVLMLQVARPRLLDAGCHSHHARHQDRQRRRTVVKDAPWR